jgi:tetratricopeptide (TPR) repeat protein
MNSLDPEESRRFLSRVEALLDQRMVDEAHDLAAERLGRLPDDVDARIAMCMVWTRMGKLDRVEEILQDVEKRISDWSRLHAAMGDICRESGLQKEAARFYERFNALHAQGTTHQTITEMRDRLTDAGAAAPPALENEDYYDHVTDIAPDFHTMTLADLYIRQHQIAMARDVLKEIIRREPHHPEAAVRLREIEDRLSGPQCDLRGPTHDRIVRELTRWLQNVGRIGNHAT